MHADSYVGVACIAYLQAYDATLFWFWLVCVAKQRLKQQEQIMLKNFIQWQQCGGFVAQQFPNALHNFFFRFADNGVCERIPLPAGLYKILWADTWGIHFSM